MDDGVRSLYPDRAPFDLTAFDERAHGRRDLVVEQIEPRAGRVTVGLGERLIESVRRWGLTACASADLDHVRSLDVVVARIDQRCRADSGLVGRLCSALPSGLPFAQSRCCDAGVTVTAEWARIVTWCQANAPVTSAAFRSPASLEAVSAVQEFFPHAWPADLDEWFGVQDGIEESPFTGNGPLPGWVPWSLAEVRETAADQVATAQELFGAEGVAGEATRPAGSQAMFWLPSFVPIARGIAADYLIVDTRPGPRHGVLKVWDAEDGTSSGPRPTLLKLLTETANCLERGTPLGGLIAEIVEGGLNWQDADHPSRAKQTALPVEWLGLYERFRAHRIAVWDDGEKTWTDDLNQEQDHLEWSARQSRYRLMDALHSVLAGDPDDVWHGGRANCVEAELAQLMGLTPHLSSDLSRQRTREIVRLTIEMQNLTRQHPR